MPGTKVAVVSGGFGCLGSAVAHALLKRGVRVALIDRSTAAAERPPVPTMQVGGIDLSRMADSTRAMDAIATTLGRIDVLVNVAGGFQWGRVAESGPELWDEMYAVNLRTAVVASMAALRYLRAAGGGRIINIGAVGATNPAAGMGAYAASKSGVRCLTEALAKELAEHAITVNAVLPTIIDTPRNRAEMPDANFSEWVTPQQVAELIASLASDETRSITGVAIAIGARS